MARYLDASCRLCRRENQKLFLKAERCYTEKCAFERRGYPPGQHGQGRIKLSEYALQLRAKQKMKRIYGLNESQFRLTFDRAARKKGITGNELINLLERRLDNVIYRVGFSGSRNQARQLVKHGHFLVNGKAVNIPSFVVKKGDQVSVAEKSKALLVVTGALEAVKRREIPQWLDLASAEFKAVVRDIPTRDDVTVPVEERLVVELYSK